jgi:Fic-DOC domain mobile mystery protein B
MELLNGVDPLQISVQLHGLLEDVKCRIEYNHYRPLEAAARFHHKLVFIHPFPNGNGRFSRITEDALLERIFKERPIDWSAGHDLQKMNERRKHYITALREADKGQYEKLLLFIG